jgi:hypothetical protein
MSQLIHNFFIQYFSKKNCTPPDTDNLIYLHHMYIYTYECMYVCMYILMLVCIYECMCVWGAGGERERMCSYVHMYPSQTRKKRFITKRSLLELLAKQGWTFFVPKWPQWTWLSEAGGRFHLPGWLFLFAKLCLRQGDQMSVCKNRPKCSPSYFAQK